MRTAIHPHKKIKVSVSDYIKDFGNNSQRDLKDYPLCPFCKQRMTIVAKSTANSTGHFKHFPKSEFCPSKEKSVALYANLPPLEPDPEKAREIKIKFVENWKAHFSQLNFFAKGLSKREFLNILIISNRSRIWEYAHLEEFQIPYILATLIDFPPENSRLGQDKKRIRNKYIRCFFDSSVTRFDDLWIDRPHSLQFWRAWYDATPGKNPTVEDLIDAYGSELDSTYLKFTPRVPPFYIEEIEDWLHSHFCRGL